MQEKSKQAQRYVELAVQVDEVILFSECSPDRQHAFHKELFRQKGHFFTFEIKRYGHSSFHTLKEIKSKKFFSTKSALLSKRPYKGCEFWAENNFSYKLKCRSHCKCKIIIDVNRCFFLTQSEDKTNHILTGYQEAIKSGKYLSVSASDDFTKNNKISLIARLSQTYDIDYENVICLGTNPQILETFQQSYHAAIAKIPALSAKELSELFRNISSGAPYAVLRNAIKRLSINCGEADLRQMNFSKLLFAIKDRLYELQTKNLNQAINQLLNKDVAEQLQIYMRLEKYSKHDKKAILEALGINIDEIDIKKFPLKSIRQALEKSLAIQEQ